MPGLAVIVIIDVTAVYPPQILAMLQASAQAYSHYLIVCAGNIQQQSMLVMKFIKYNAASITAIIVVGAMTTFPSSAVAMMRSPNYLGHAMASTGYQFALQTSHPKNKLTTTLPLNRNVIRNFANDYHADPQADTQRPIQLKEAFVAAIVTQEGPTSYDPTPSIQPHERDTEPAELAQDASQSQRDAQSASALVENFLSLSDPNARNALSGSSAPNFKSINSQTVTNQTIKSDGHINLPSSHTPKEPIRSIHSQKSAGVRAQQNLRQRAEESIKKFVSADNQQKATLNSEYALKGNAAMSKTERAKLHTGLDRLGVSPHTKLDVSKLQGPAVPYYTSKNGGIYPVLSETKDSAWARSENEENEVAAEEKQFKSAEDVPVVSKKALVVLWTKKGAMYTTYERIIYGLNQNKSLVQQDNEIIEVFSVDDRHILHNCDADCTLRPYYFTCRSDFTDKASLEGMRFKQNNEFLREQHDYVNNRRRDKGSNYGVVKAPSRRAQALRFFAGDYPIDEPLKSIVHQELKITRAGKECAVAPKDLTTSEILELRREHINECHKSKIWQPWPYYLVEPKKQQAMMLAHIVPRNGWTRSGTMKSTDMLLTFAVNNTIPLTQGGELMKNAFMSFYAVLPDNAASFNYLVYRYIFRHASAEYIEKIKTLYPQLDMSAAYVKSFQDPKYTLYKDDVRNFQAFEKKIMEDREKGKWFLGDATFDWQ